MPLLDDLKLSGMGQVAGRIVAGLTLILAAAYVLQLDDSVRPAQSRPAAPSLQVSPILVAQAETASREYFVSHHQVTYVPVGRQTITLPILMYHYIRPLPSPRTDLMGYRLSVAPEVFQSQMDWLSSNGYHAVNFNDVRAYFAGVRPLPAKPVVITLDDGYSDLYTTAYPILAAHRFTAVAYIVTSFVGQPRYVSAAQVLEMDRAGIEIASHTIDHADLARASYANALYQLVQSRHWLENLVGHQVLDFAYPSGKFNLMTMSAVQQAGYDTAVTEQLSLLHSRADRYAWARVRVGGGESLSDFVTSLGASMPAESINVNDVEVEPGAIYRETHVRSQY